MQLVGDKAATDAAFAKAAHVVKHRFVINRVTAATMEPRGSVGDYNAADDRYTIYTTLQRAHPYRAELAPMLKVPESKVRVVAGDIGGSFGMKSAIYNEVALVLLASKTVGRPVKWISTRSEAFLCDAQARDNVTEAELALDKDGTFLGLRVKIDRRDRRLSAGRHAGLHRQSRHARRRLPHARRCMSTSTAVFTHTKPVRPYRGNGRPEAAYVIERMVDLAADELKHRSGRAAAQELHPAGGDAVQDRAHLHLRLRRVREEHGHGAQARRLSRASTSAAPRRRSAASCAARHLQHHRARGRAAASRAPKSASTAPARSRCSRAASTRARATRPSSSRSSCDRLGIDPDEVHYIQGDTDKVFFGEGTGGSRSATSAARRVIVAAEKIIAKAKAIAAHLLKVDVADVKFEDGIFSSTKTNQTMTIKEVAQDAVDPAKLPKDMEPA